MREKTRERERYQELQSERERAITRESERVGEIRIHKHTRSKKYREK